MNRAAVTFLQLSVDMHIYVILWGHIPRYGNARSQGIHEKIPPNGSPRLP